MGINNNKNKGSHWESVWDIQKLDPQGKEVNITFNYLRNLLFFQIELFPYPQQNRPWLPSSVTWGNVYKSSMPLNWIWESLCNDIIHLTQQEWAEKAILLREPGKIVGPLYSLCSDVIVSLPLRRGRKVQFGLSPSRNGSRPSPGPSVNNNPIVRSHPFIPGKGHSHLIYIRIETPPAILLSYF